MLLNDIQMSATGHSALYPDLARRPAPADDWPDTAPPFVDPLELEALALILEHSLKVHSTQHFFCWTQGLVQNLIRHEVLICALRKSESAAFHVDSFSSAAGEPALINNLFTQDTTLVPHLLKCWEGNHFQPVLFEMAGDALAAGSSLGREFQRLGVGQIVGKGQGGIAALLVPSLHTAWVHTQYARPALAGQARSANGGNDLLTARELEILGWIYRGKSNIEIGMILGISPLTVKNHVQKILRRLNVLNRAQAVGKALALRILDTSGQR